MMALHSKNILQRLNAVFVSAKQHPALFGSTKRSYSSGSMSSDEHDSSPSERNLQAQGVDPHRGWNFRGVHKAIICGKIGDQPVQKILRNGRTVTIFTVGTSGMHDQRVKVGSPRPLQWHRVAVHNELLGAYAVQRLVKNSSVYVEGDIEIRVYNDNIDGKVKSIPEICVRQNGRVNVVDDKESPGNLSLDDLNFD